MILLLMKKEKIWYYYKENGQMQTDGWVKMKDTNKWYLFANYGADGWSYSDAETDGVGNRETILNGEKEVIL